MLRIKKPIARLKKDERFLSGREEPSFNPKKFKNYGKRKK